MFSKFFCFLIFVFIPLLGYAQAPVIVSEISTSIISDEVEALGTLRANESVELTANVTELITAVYFTDGQRVKKGQTLIEMDASEEVAELEEEKSRLEEAKKQVKRLSALSATNASAQSLLDEQQREVDTAQARIRAANSRIALRSINAPFDGLLGLRNVSVGSLVQPGDTITTLDDDSVMKLDFSVPSVFLSVIRPDVKIQATSDAFPDTIFEGTISSVDSRVDPVTRSILVRAVLNNPERRLRPGLLMSVTIPTSPRSSILVPEEAIILQGNKHYVLSIQAVDAETTVERRQIVIGTRIKGYAEVLSGLSAGDKVVTHGITRAAPGKQVKIIGVQNPRSAIASIIESTNESG